MPTIQQPHFAKIRTWLNEIHQEKRAAATTKSGKAYSEPGGYVGETTHPSKDVDDGLEKAKEGERSSENESDVKKTEFKGNVNETPDNPGPKQEDLNLNMGVRQSATGEEPSVEDDYRTRQSEPGTSHPANMEIGEKYSAWVKKEAGELSNLANDILADIATGNGFGPALNIGNAPTEKAPATEKAAQSQPQAGNNVAAAQAGYELATLMGMSKESADQVTQNVIAETIKQAQTGADRVGAYLLSFMKESEALSKKSADATSGDESEAGPPAGGPGGIPPEALAAAAGPGGGAPPVGPGAGAGPDMGGPPPDAAGAGGPPGMGGGAGGAGGHDQALQELAMALMELGISPEELATAMSQGGPGGAGGPPPDAAGAGGPPGMGGPAGGPPPDAGGGPAEMGAKIASAVYNYKRSGKFKVAEAKTAAQRQQRDEMKRYVLEIMGNRG